MSCGCNVQHRFYICKHCGNIVGMIESSGVPIVCCGEEMSELIAGSVDAAKEKHVPVVSVSGNLVTVMIGEVPHPMEEKHYIQWVYLQTAKGGQRKCLKPGDEPKLVFALTDDDTAVRAYEYCNLHGLWVADIK